MKWKLLAVIGAVPLLGTSCSTMDLGGSLPVPFTNPATDVTLELDFRPLPPRFCIGLDLVPREEPAAVSETAK